ncbi:MAG: glycosyltransferase family 39 protein [Elusimicrobia bacterium]|nr:glycosyltransferase family 39 protein [Elusimicrobiota bacterium]
MAESSTTATRRALPTSLAVGLAGLAAFLLWQAWLLHGFTRRDTRPPAWDQAIHLEIAYDYRAALAGRNWGDLWHLRPKPGMPPFPPMYHWGIIVAQGVLGSGSDPKAAADAALWLNWVYLALLCGCIFGLAWEFLGDESALAAAVAFGCAPNVQWLLRNQLIDLPLAALAAAVYWAYIRSDGLRLWPGTVACALACAAGFLHKWSFFSYLFPLVLAVISYRGDLERRKKALAALAIVAALAAPWYVANLPPLFPRLFQASADFAIPFWRGGAFFTYFVASMEELGLGLFLLGWIGMLTIRLKRKAAWTWLLPEWVILSYLFWTIVPNRQFRFLLPGLPALAILACGPFPRPLIWGMAALQVFGALNYATGWIKPVALPTPVLSASFLSSEPPAPEDWKLVEIVREAAARKPADAAFANVTLIANDTRFNGPTFNWIVKRTGVPVKIRGVNSRLCEFSQFVLLKKGSLGPGSVIGGLPEAAALVDAKGGWFDRAYAEAKRWPLPDGNEAVLYEQRKPAKPPIPPGRRQLPAFVSGAFEASDLYVEFGPWDAGTSTYDWIRLSAASARLRGLALSDLRAELRRARLVQVKEGDALGDVRLLKLGTLRLSSATIAAADLGRFAEERARGLKVESVQLDGNAVLRGAYKGIPLAAGVSAGLTNAPRGLYVGVSKAELSLLSVPAFLLARISPFLLSFDPTPEMPFTIEVPSVSMKEGRLKIGG